MTNIDENSKQIFTTVEDIPQLEYAEKVLRETMHPHPPAWAIGRQAIHDYKIGNYIIENGSVILMSQYIMHNDSRYFPEPNLFYLIARVKSQNPNFHVLVIFHLEEE